MGQNVIIIYGTASGMVRRVIRNNDNEAEIDASKHVGRGEASLSIAKSAIHSVADIHAAVAAATGIPKPDPRCAVINNGKVESIIAADPNLDMVPGRTLVQAYDGVKPGHDYDTLTKTFSSPIVHITIPSGTVNPITGVISIIPVIGTIGGPVPKPSAASIKVGG